MFMISSLWIRLIGAGLSFVLLCLFINPMLLGIRNVGNFTGAGVSLCAFLFFALNPLIAPWLGRVWENGFGHVVLCVLMGGLGAAALLSVIISGFMLRAIHDTPKKAQPVIILGCKVKNGGPSLMLRKRLDAAVPYLRAHPEVPVIVSGGQGRDEAVSEAQCMYTYLTAQGIAAERIVQEDTSTSTIENLSHAKEILTEHEWGTQAVIVTDGYHQLRASMIARSIGLDTDALSAPTSWYLVPTYWVREWLGVCYQVVFG